MGSKCAQLSAIGFRLRTIVQVVFWGEGFKIDSKQDLIGSKPALIVRKSLSNECKLYPIFGLPKRVETTTSHIRTPQIKTPTIPIGIKNTLPELGRSVKRCAFTDAQLAPQETPPVATPKGCCSMIFCWMAAR
jgi:hypothetical protein